MKQLFLLRGLPGAGKTTIAESIGGKHVEADMFFKIRTGKYEFNPKELPDAHKWCLTICEGWMSDSEPTIVVSNTFTQEWEMENYIDAAKDFGYRVHTLVVENRHGGKNIHNVPDEVLDKMENRFSIKLR